MKLDCEASRLAIIANLPLRARWMIDETPLDYDFSIARHPLRELSDEIVVGGKNEWPDLLIFGRDDYAEGGGASSFIGIRKTDGAVCGLDLERENALFFLNSSIENYIRTFRLLDKFLGNNQQLPPDVRGRVQAIDPEVYLRSEWRFLLDET